jgi:type II secretory pathway predicted ATPase ExeA
MDLRRDYDIPTALIVRHWGLQRDPFCPSGVGYVKTPVHDEAVARLTHAVSVGERRASLCAEPGLGKSLVLAKVLAELRDPHRRIAVVTNPIGGASMFEELARQLGARGPHTLERPSAWLRLVDAVRVCRVQKLEVVLAIDDDRFVAASADGCDLERLAHVDPHPDSRLTVLRVSRNPSDELNPTQWELPIRLKRLTRSETSNYLHAKIASAGRDEPVFSALAITRLHLWTAGVPRGVDRLASIALLAGASEGYATIEPVLIDGAARECDCLPDPITLCADPV